MNSLLKDWWCISQDHLNISPGHRFLYLDQRCKVDAHPFRGRNFKAGQYNYTGRFRTLSYFTNCAHMIMVSDSNNCYLKFFTLTNQLRVILLFTEPMIFTSIIFQIAKRIYLERAAKILCPQRECHGLLYIFRPSIVLDCLLYFFIHTITPLKDKRYLRSDHNNPPC